MAGDANMADDASSVETHEDEIGEQAPPLSSSRECYVYEPSYGRQVSGGLSGGHTCPIGAIPPVLYPPQQSVPSQSTFAAPQSAFGYIGVQSPAIASNQAVVGALESIGRTIETSVVAAVEASECRLARDIEQQFSRMFTAVSALERRLAQDIERRFAEMFAVISSNVQSGSDLAQCTRALKEDLQTSFTVAVTAAFATTHAKVEAQVQALQTASQDLDKKDKLFVTDAVKMAVDKIAQHRDPLQARLHMTLMDAKAVIARRQAGDREIKEYLDNSSQQAKDAHLLYKQSVERTEEYTRQMQKYLSELKDDLCDRVVQELSRGKATPPATTASTAGVNWSHTSSESSSLNVCPGVSHCEGRHVRSSAADDEARDDEAKNNTYGSPLRLPGPGPRGFARVEKSQAPRYFVADDRPTNGPNQPIFHFDTPRDSPAGSFSEPKPYPPRCQFGPN